MYRTNTLTTLARELKNGDEYAYFNNLNNWNDTTIPFHQFTFIFWNYQDSSGYKYQPFTYSRNYFNDVFSANSIDRVNNRIKLKSPWSSGSYPAGTNVSQGSAGGHFNYGILGYQNPNISIPNIVDITGVTSGEQEIQGPYNNFRNGAQYIKMLFLINNNSIPDTTTCFKDIVLEKID